jgi:hypothetical protein
VQVTAFVDGAELQQLLERVVAHEEEVERRNSVPAFWLLNRFL